MDTPVDLDALEERAFRSRYDDGLLDLVVGLSVLALGLTIGTEWAGMAGVWPAVFVSLWHAVRPRLTEPRHGYVEFRRGRVDRTRRKLNVMTLVLGVSVLAGVGLWIAHAADNPGLREMIRPLGPIPFAAMLALVVAVGSALLKIARGHVYAALILVLVTAGHLIGFEGSFRVSLTLAGALVTLAGAWVLARFLRDNPLPPEEGDRGPA